MLVSGQIPYGFALQHQGVFLKLQVGQPPLHPNTVEAQLVMLWAAGAINAVVMHRKRSPALWTALTLIT